MAEIFIRNAGACDVGAISEIRNYYIIHTDYNLSYEPYTQEEADAWFKNYAARFPILAAESEGQVVGWASLTTFRDFRGYDKSPELSLYVRKDFHRRGVGAKLMLELEREGRKRDFHCIVSVITGNNRPSIAMHNKFGFETSGVLKEAAYKNGKYFDVIFMTKLLSTKEMNLKDGL